MRSTVTRRYEFPTAGDGSKDDSTRSATGSREPSRVGFAALLSLGALGFLSLLAVFSLASSPTWRRPELALFSLPVLLLLGAVAGGLGLLGGARWRRRARRPAPQAH